MKNLEMLFRENNQKSRQEEDKLGKELEVIYNSAVAEATKEFEKLQEVGDAKFKSRIVQKIIKETTKKFSTEMIKMVEPLKKTIVSNYDEGLVETSEVLKNIKNES